MKWALQVVDVLWKKAIHGEEEGKGGMQRTLIIIKRTNEIVVG